MVGSMVHQLMNDASVEQIKADGVGSYYANHDKAVHPSSGTGVPVTAAYIKAKGDPIADIHETWLLNKKQEPYND